MMRFFVFALLSLFAFSCSDKEICTDNCGPLQTCVDGVCECPEDHYQIDKVCRKIRNNDFFGELPCGCLGKLILNTATVEKDERLFFSQGLGSGWIWPVTQLSDGSLKATLNKGCNLDNGTSYAVDFTVKELNENELHVHARWWNLEVGTLEECESVFVH